MEYTTASENNKGTYLIQRDKYNEPMGESIITLIGLEDGKEWFGTLGNYKVTDVFDTKDELIEYLDSKPYMVMLAIVTAHLQIMEETSKMTNDELAKLD